MLRVAGGGLTIARGRTSPARGRVALPPTGVITHNQILLGCGHIGKH